VTDTLSKEDDLLSDTEVMPATPVTPKPSFPCGVDDCTKEFTTPMGRGAHQRFAHGIKGAAAKKKKPAPKKKAPAESKPRQPATAVVRRKSAAEIIGEIFSGLGGVVQTFDAPLGNVLAFEAPAAGLAIDKAVAGTALDRIIVQPLAGGAERWEALGAILALPLMIKLIEMQPALLVPLEPRLRSAVGQVLVYSLPAIKRRAEEERKVADALAELGALDPSIGKGGDPVGDIVRGLLAPMFEAPGADEPE